MGRRNCGTRGSLAGTVGVILLPQIHIHSCKLQIQQIIVFSHQFLFVFLNTVVYYVTFVYMSLSLLSDIYTLIALFTRALYAELCMD